MIERFLDSFSKISLNDMESTRLMNRIDFKYMFRKDDLGDVLTQLQPYYHVLRMSSKTVFRYDTLYFDTPERLFYHQHLHGKLNRYKVRARRYVDTDAQFLEVKLKDNKRRTIKKRIAIEELSLDLCPTSTDFLDNIADDFSAMALEPTVWVYYHRFTLVNKTCPERVTFDLNMWFRWQDQSGIYPHIVVAEAKQRAYFQSPFTLLMRDMGIREGGLSKYCLGLMSVEPGIKANLFKPMYSKIHRLNEY
ncbi:MAG: polyphosphate polymerase domain-containing protein [Bacteroidetes bacterium]|nr:polyphosphate polymerase domain-containing protein [Bacteroidota bacterium]